MSFLKGFNIRDDKIKYSIIVICVLLLLDLIFLKNIPKLITTILFILLGPIFILNIWPIKYEPLFKAMNDDNLNKFKEYLSNQNLKPSNIHKIEHIYGKTPIIYAMERRAYNIFKYLVENDYDLNYFTDKTEPVITFAAHSAELKFLQLLLKNKNRFDLNAINKKFGANALEIAVWRQREEIVEALINAGMNFSIKKYNNTEIGQSSTPFENIPLNIKTALLKRFVFNKTIKQLNMVNEISEKNQIKSFKDKKIYWDEYLQFA